MLSFFPRDVLDEILNFSQFLRVFLPTLTSGLYRGYFINVGQWCTVCPDSLVTRIGLFMLNI